MIKKTIVVLTMLLVFVACGLEPETVYVEITSTPEPTLVPSDTPEPTNTPEPTPEPTNTPKPACGTTLKDLEDTWDVSMSDDSPFEYYEHYGEESNERIAISISANTDMNGCVYEAALFFAFGDNAKTSDTDYIGTSLIVFAEMMDPVNKSDGVDFVSQLLTDRCPYITNTEEGRKEWEQDFVDSIWQFACGETDEGYLFLYFEIFTNTDGKNG